jgi:hypothetical protein
MNNYKENLYVARITVSEKHPPLSDQKLDNERVIQNEISIPR